MNVSREEPGENYAKEKKSRPRPLGRGRGVGRGERLRAADRRDFGLLLGPTLLGQAAICIERNFRLPPVSLNVRVVRFEVVEFFGVGWGELTSRMSIPFDHLAAGPPSSAPAYRPHHIATARHQKARHQKTEYGRCRPHSGDINRIDHTYHTGYATAGMLAKLFFVKAVNSSS